MSIIEITKFKILQRGGKDPDIQVTRTRFIPSRKNLHSTTSDTDKMQGKSGKQYRHRT
jgi:hypothetical protein